MGDYARAEEFYERALKIREEKFGEGIELAQSENALGDLYFATGDYDKAEPRLKRALSLRRKKLSAITRRWRTRWKVSHTFTRLRATSNKLSRR
jgi:tetratricopeptide (TPR) repeat protein